LGCRKTLHPILVLPAASPALPDLVARVSGDSLLALYNDVCNYPARHSPQQQELVAHRLYQWLKSRKLNCHIQSYRRGNHLFENIWVEWPGVSHPENIVIFGAHFDATSQNPDTLSPGADDNGSGLTALLHIGQILHDVSPVNTLRLVFFSNEEQGLGGSRRYVQELLQHREKIVAAVILDMIGYSKDTGSLHAVTVPEYRWLAQSCQELLRSLGRPLLTIHVGKDCH
jgi:acetylornithine deacetylase/succinyl-diaminopimelate desuccinylase-like protein